MNKYRKLSIGHIFCKRGSIKLISTRNCEKKKPYNLTANLQKHIVNFVCLTQTQNGVSAKWEQGKMYVKWRQWLKICTGKIFKVVFIDNNLVQIVEWTTMQCRRNKMGWNFRQWFSRSRQTKLKFSSLMVRMWCIK